MKKILSLLVLFPLMVIGQTQTENYIKTTNYKTPTTTSIATPTAQQATQSITYFDGLGRPLQQVAHQQSGSGKDIVTPMQYDAFGRQDKEYLPYVPTTPASLDYKSAALTDVRTFYAASQYATDFPGMSTSDINPYSQKDFEPSPLNRVLKQAASGKDWKLGNGHEIRLDYQTNDNADQVRRFGVSFVNGNTEAPHLEDNGIYDLNQLYKTITKDENWQVNQLYPNDHTTQEFKDKQGRVILKRTFDAGKWYDTYYVYDDYGNLTYVLPPKVFTYHSITQPYQGQSSYYSSDWDSDFSLFTILGDYSEYSLYQWGEDSMSFNLYSYNFIPGSVLFSGKIADLDFTPNLPDMTLGEIMVTDVNGSLVVGGTASIQNGDLYFTSNGVGVYPDSNGEFYSNTTIKLSNFQANYTPQALNRATLDDLIYQYKYDSRNRLVEKKLPGKEWEYIVYDKLDRPILTQDANLKTLNKWLFIKYDAFSRPVYTGEYINATVGQTSRTDVQGLADLSTTMFETKQGVNTINGTTVYYSNTAFPNVANLNLFTINYYDDYNFDLNGGSSTPSYGVTPIANAKGLTTGSKARVLGTSNWIINVSYYDAKGRPIYSYSKNDYLATTSTVKSQLDFVGKTLETTSTHQRNAVTTTVVDAFTYDQAGRLTKQTQAINGAGTPEVIVANTYDELGQLISKKVGGKTINGLQKVDYSYNIRGWLKNINDPNNLNQDNDLFGFGLNYNTIANTSLPVYSQNIPLYNGNISSTSWKSNSLNTILKEYNYTYDALNRFKTANYVENNILNYKFNETINGYDRNGNIMGINRNMQNPTNVNSWTQIDYLNYTYDAGNKLLAVKDYSGLSATGIEGFKDGTNTGDDYSYDTNGNMTIDNNKGITAIAYNHLNLPTKITFPTGTIDYVYDATGVKQRKIVSTGTTTDYAGGFQYENNQLKFFPQPEGYVDCISGNFNYIYQYKDHLGNVRLSYGDKDNNGIITGDTTVDVFNDGFETSNNWDNLGQVYGISITGYDTTRKHSGNVSGKIVKLTGGEQVTHSDTAIAINNTQPTDYIVSGWVYSDNPQVELFLFMKTSTETGYYTKVESVLTNEKNKWVYIEKRVIVPTNIAKLNVRIDNNGGGTVWFDDISIKKVNSGTNEIVEENNYYPFGLKHKDSNNVVTSTSAGYKYKYNGKELQDELGLNMYDYGARNYDPAVGRWVNVDPLAEEMTEWSPYNYVLGNPVRLVDPDGKGPGDTIGGFIVGLVDNVAGTNIRSKHGGTDFDNGAQLADVVSLLGGAILGGKGLADMTAGTAGLNSSIAVTAGTGGLSVEVSGPAAVASGALFGVGAIEAKAGNNIFSNAMSNLKNGNSNSTNSQNNSSEKPKQTNKVEKSVTTEPVGKKYSKTTEVRPSKQQPGQSRAEYVRYKNSDGKVIKTYKDSYDRSNTFQHRKPLTGGPEGRK